MAKRKEETTFNQAWSAGAPPPARHPEVSAHASPARDGQRGAWAELCGMGVLDQRRAAAAAAATAANELVR